MIKEILVPIKLLSHLVFTFACFHSESIMYDLIIMRENFKLLLKFILTYIVLIINHKTLIINF